MNNSLSRTIGALCTVAFISVATSCGDDKTTTTDTADTVPAIGEIAFVGQWARTSPAMATAGVVYVTITSPVEDNLVGASVAAGVAARGELHETVAVENATDTTTMMGGGEMTMQPVEFVELPAGVSVELKPGGLHIMLIGLVEPLEIGNSIQVTLMFEKAGEISIEVPVLDEAP